MAMLLILVGLAVMMDHPFWGELIAGLGVLAASNPSEADTCAIGIVGVVGGLFLLYVLHSCSSAMHQTGLGG
ncbi:hypothetical protein [Marinobacterium aestuarii]|nr:hypothetical protein [Marinobacterium aestuarii]